MLTAETLGTNTAIRTSKQHKAGSVKQQEHSNPASWLERQRDKEHARSGLDARRRGEPSRTERQSDGRADEQRCGIPRRLRVRLRNITCDDKRTAAANNEAN